MMYSLNDYAHSGAIAKLPLSEDMQPSSLMSQMLGFLSVSHEPCFFLQATFLKRLPVDIQSHLVHDRTSDPLTLALHAYEIFQSRVSSFSTVNHVSSTPVLGDE